MFADYYLPSTDSLMESATKLSKIAVLFRYKAKPNPHHHLSTAENWLDPEPGRTPAPRMGPVRFRGIQSIRDSATSSTKICRIFFQDLTTKGHE
ncbi:MAG: hypothetical protein DME31_08560 [Verrucomicrobia bacterium]|nr:MAG: hypothetical protein DME31_08560 [Verrucomicrobiota bacterium]